jgi:ElaB/YqjD/DUF883 family membrane-anchored ribosome-binding protein
MSDTTPPATGTAPKTRAARSTQTDSITESPLALLAGGVALGVLIGVLLPRAAKERELLDPVGRKLAANVTDSAKAAKDAARAEIESLLPDRDATRDRVNKLIETVLDAAKGAGAKA